MAYCSNQNQTLLCDAMILQSKYIFVFAYFWEIHMPIPMVQSNNNRVLIWQKQFFSVITHRYVWSIWWIVSYYLLSSVGPELTTHSFPFVSISFMLLLMFIAWIVATLRLDPKAWFNRFFNWTGLTCYLENFFSIITLFNYTDVWTDRKPIIENMKNASEHTRGI